MMPPYPAWDHSQWTEYFSGDLTNSVNNDIAPLLPSALFGIPRQFFPYIEYLGGLVFGPSGGRNLSSTPLAKRFLDVWMSRIDPRYSQQSDHLLEMWRHGLIHTYKPKVLQHPASNRLLGWLSYSGPQTVPPGIYRPLDFTVSLRHLEIVVNPKGDLDWLPVSIDCLVTDLSKVLELLATEVSSEYQAGGTALLNQLSNAALSLEQPTPSQSPW